MSVQTPKFSEVSCVMFKRNFLIKSMGKINISVCHRSASVTVRGTKRVSASCWSI